MLSMGTGYEQVRFIVASLIGLLQTGFLLMRIFVCFHILAHMITIINWKKVATCQFLML